MNLLFLTGAKFSGILELNGNFNISRSMTRLTPFVHQGQLNRIAIQAGFIIWNLALRDEMITRLDTALTIIAVFNRKENKRKTIVLFPLHTLSFHGIKVQ